MKMKKSQLKSGFIVVMVFSLFIVLVYAAVNGVTLNYPTNTWVTSNSVNFNFTANSSSSLVSYCAVFVNNSGTLQVKANYTDVINGTPHISGIAVNDSVQINTYGWNVTCNNGTNDFGAGGISAFGVDGNVPSITQNNPANGAYLTSLNDTLFQYTPIDTSNPLDCDFYTNLSGVWQPNQTNRSYGSGVKISVNISDNISSRHTAANIPDGKYVWAATCNDTAGNGNRVFTQNRSFIIDTIDPTSISFSVPFNLNQTNRTLYVEWSPTVEANFDRYDALLSSNANASNPTQTITITTKSTNFTTFSSVVDGSYFIQIRAYDLANHYVNSTIRNYVVDNVAPVLTLNFPSNNSFLTDNTPDFNVTIVDTNPNSCTLLMNQSSSVISNGTKMEGISNGTMVNLTPITMADGVYTFNIECNDTVNNRVNVSLPLLFTTIDTVVPSAPFILSTFHQTNDTNKIPNLLWSNISEINFSKYQVRASYLINNSVAYEVNITSQKITFAQLNLSENYTYTFNVTAYDLAGNTNSSGNTTIQTRYYVDSVCGVLNTGGWNLCGATWRTAKNLTQIGAETGANLIAVWNQSHQFATCNYALSPTGQHCNVQTNISNSLDNFTEDKSINHAVFIYVNTTKNWNNRTWSANEFSSNITLTNASGIGWNLEAGFTRGGRVFGNLKNMFDMNVSLFSLPLNNGSTIAYVNNGLFKTINNNTNLEYGRGIWLFYNGTGIDTGGTHLISNNTFNMSYRSS